MSPGTVVSPGGETRERSLLTVNQGTEIAIGETMIGTGVTPSAVIRE